MDFQAEALREWKQNTIGTATTPPVEFVQAYAIARICEQTAELVESVMRIEARVSRLESADRIG